MGRVSILEWAYSKGFDFDATALVDHDYIVGKPPLYSLAAENGHVHLLEWTGGIQESGHGCRLSYDCFLCCRIGKSSFWARLAERLRHYSSYIQTERTRCCPQLDICHEAASFGHLQAFDWLLENGFDHHKRTISGIAVHAAAILGLWTVLEWVKARAWI
jgi:hypothetical protein